MRIGRAHSYDDVEKLRAALSLMPQQWLPELDWVAWQLLPEGLFPLFVGLLIEDRLTHDGRSYSDLGGWFANTEHGWIVTNTRHIYLSSRSIERYAIHEAGHALEVAWRVDVRWFFWPQSAFHWYMQTNPSEYFACAVEAFCIPDTNEKEWNRGDLAAMNPPLHEFLSAKAEQAQNFDRIRR